VQLTMKFKLFNATTMHNSTEKCQKKSDLNQKNLIFSIFLLKIMIFSNPVWHCKAHSWCTSAHRYQQTVT